MDIDSFRCYLESTRPAYSKWGQHVASIIENKLNSFGFSSGFIKIPVAPRVKTEESAVGKLARKGYESPLQEMTDLVGIRFVVLLSDDILTVSKIISDELTWCAEVSRDFAQEIESNSKSFDYQSQHFEVRPKVDFELDSISITTDMCCEVQVRTLLQHAYAEMVHDNIYKPSGPVPSKAERHVARSMALIETADDLFCRTMEFLKEASAPRIDLLKDLSSIYRDNVGGQYLVADNKTAFIVMDEFKEYVTDGLSNKINILLNQKKYIVQKIISRASSVELFNQSAVLLVYWLALNHNVDDLVKRWPLPGYWKVLKIILADVDRHPSY